MAVAVLPDERLLLYSPVWPTPEMRRAVDALGDVAYLLSPNKIHNQTLRPCAEAWPGAEVHVPPGLPERCPALPVTALLGDEAPPAWRDEFDQALTAGNVFFSEAVLLHRPSKTLLVGDLVENFDEHTIGAAARLAARVFGVRPGGCASPEFQYYTHGADAAAAALERIAAWDFERIFLCHGQLVEAGAREVFRRVADELLETARRRGRVARLLFRAMARLQ